MEAWERFAAAALLDSKTEPAQAAATADQMMVEWRKRYQPPMASEAAQQAMAGPTCWCGMPAKHVIRHRLRHTVNAQKFQLCDGHLAAYRSCAEAYEREQFLVGEPEVQKG